MPQFSVEFGLQSVLYYIYCQPEKTCLLSLKQLASPQTTKRLVFHCQPAEGKLISAAFAALERTDDLIGVIGPN